MGVYFLLALHLLILETVALSCLPREYQMNNICCPMCGKGLFVKSHCTPQSSSSLCVICADNTYMDHPNGLTECFRCKECDAGVGLVVKEQCTAESNTVCECKADHYCLNQECDWCHEHKVCPPGEYLKTPGTGQEDAVCAKCPSKHFSNKNNSAECLPWQECSKSNLVLYKEGTSTTDSICKEKRGRAGVYASLFPVIILTILIIYFSCLKPGKYETAEEGDDGSYRIPKQEIPIPPTSGSENSHSAGT